MRHAYPDTLGQLTLKAWVDDGELMLLVVDEGIVIGSATSEAGLGLGLPLMRELPTYGSPPASAAPKSVSPSPADKD